VAGNTEKSALKKVDDEMQVVWGEVYAPGYPDSQGDYMTADEIRKAAYKFMAAGRVNKIDHEHNEVESGAYVVESFIARDDDPVFIPGSWVTGVHIPDPGMWAMVKSGEINGFSFGGKGFKKPGALIMEIPEVLKGETDQVESHAHTFSVHYGPKGEFLGGRTDEAADGHYHVIVKGTVTEPAHGHTHRFSFVEGLLNGQG
jgi:hypothetical protein